MTEIESTWDRAVNSWMQGGSSIPDELAAWSQANSGRGDAAPNHDALPEPWFGDRLQPKAVFLALNPGQAFLGTERWHQSRLLPDLQSRVGTFAQEIKEQGSYARWAERFPAWHRWVSGGNPFYEVRFRFARDWTSNAAIKSDNCLLVELYPWHSRTFNAGAFRPGSEALEQIAAFVLKPLELPAAKAPVFAFGSAWFSVLTRMGFEETMSRSVRDGHALGNVKDRTVSIFQRENLRIIAEKHAGGAGPPKQSDVKVIRELILPHLA